MAVDYKKELESASKNMILVHDPHVLIKLILRMIVQKVKVSHAGILLENNDRNYVLAVSKGPSGIKIPVGFARIDADNPLIRYFDDYKRIRVFKERAFVCDKAKKALRRKLSPDVKHLLKDALYQLTIFGAVACIPGYFRDDLLALLLLGKKKKGNDFAQDEIDFFIALASDVAMAIRNARLFSDLEAELNKKQRLFIHTTIALAAAIDAKDHYTHGHTNRVTALSLEIAKRLPHRNDAANETGFIEQLQIAGLLHDIGKIGIPESILNKDGPLDKAEWEKMKEHPLVGAAILQPIKELSGAILGVKYHHENYDGSGYPEGLKNEEIPLIAAIISVADTFDAMTTNRPYRPSLSKEQAIAEIERIKGRQLNPDLCQILIDLYRENKLLAGESFEQGTVWRNA